MKSNYLKILGAVILLICILLLIIFKLENDTLDFFIGFFATFGVLLLFGLIPGKKKN